MVAGGRIGPHPLSPPLILLPPHPVLHWLSVLKGLSQQRKSSQSRDQVRAGEIKWWEVQSVQGIKLGGSSRSKELSLQIKSEYKGLSW